MLSAHLGNRLLVELHRLNDAQAQAVLVRNAQGCARAQDTFLHVDTDNDRGLGVEAGVLHHLQDAREDSFIAVLGLSFQLALLNVGGELVEQVIDDVRSEDLDALFVSKLLRVRHHTHVEGENSCEFLFGAFGQLCGCRLNNILSVDGTNVDLGHWNLALQQEFKQRFK